MRRRDSGDLKQTAALLLLAVLLRRELAAAARHHLMRGRLLPARLVQSRPLRTALQTALRTSKHARVFVRQRPLVDGVGAPQVLGDAVFGPEVQGCDGIVIVGDLRSEVDVQAELVVDVSDHDLDRTCYPSSTRSSSEIGIPKNDF